MKSVEKAFSFVCEGDKLCGILHQPANPGERGVLVVVGGPQYRVGSHRQFVLLARRLADSGISVMRFDYRGMGDSEGTKRSFEEIDLDIKSAINAFTGEAGVTEVVLWGLCDAAFASISYAYQDPRVVGVVALNPWVRSEQGLAKAYLRHYYVSRLFSGQFWRKVLDGQFNVGRSLLGLFGNLGKASGIEIAKSTVGSIKRPARTDRRQLGERMAEGLKKFSGNTLFILSGQDLTAAEFMDVSRNSVLLKKELDKTSVEIRQLPDADHTFSDSQCRIRAENWTLEWVKSW